MANLWEQAKSIIPAAQQVFQNIGYTQQQGRGTRGILPRQFGGLVAPAYAAEGGGGQVLGTGSSGFGGLLGPLNTTKTVARGGTTGTTGTTVPTGTEPSYYLSSPGGGGISDVEAAYAPVIAAINALEANYQQQYPAMQTQITGEYEAQKPGIETARTTQLGRLTTGRTEAQAAEKSAIAKARGMYNELRQGELARLSAMGLSSSSVAEGSMEMLGRQAMANVGGAQQELTGTLTKIAEEERSINSFFDNKLTELEQQKQNALNEARMVFNDNMLKIAQMRVATEEAKANSRLNALAQYQSQVQAIGEFNANMRLALDKWATEKTRILDAAKAKLANVAQYQTTIDPMTGQLAGYTPTTASYRSGPYTYYYKAGGSETPTTDEELYNTLFGGQ